MTVRPYLLERVHLAKEAGDAGDPRLLFSLILCFGGARAVILWQHGGREVVEYLDLGTSTNHTAACGGREGPEGDVLLLLH